MPHATGEQGQPGTVTHEVFWAVNSRDTLTHTLLPLPTPAGTPLPLPTHTRALVLLPRCHVMEHESFESEETAAIMNASATGSSNNPEFQLHTMPQSKACNACNV